MHVSHCTAKTLFLLQIIVSEIYYTSIYIIKYDICTKNT